MRRCLSLLAIAGCATTGTALKPTHEAVDGKPAQRAADTIPQPRFDVVPAELGDKNVLGRLRARVIVRRWDMAWLAPDGERIGGEYLRGDSNDVVPVIDAAKKIRIVIEDDGARIAVWIARENAQPTVLAPTTIGTDAIGIVLRPGLPLVLGEKLARGRAVTSADRALVVNATLPPERIGLVYVAPPDDPPPSLGPPENRSWAPPKDPRPHVLVAPLATIHATRSSTSDMLAKLRTDELLATLVAEHGEWLEIELHRPFVRIRGFVQAGHTRPDDARVAITQGGGHGFGVSRSVTHTLPAGTCLYDRVDGDVIGTTLEARPRIGGSVAEHWAMVYVDTIWGTQKLFIHDLGDDPTTPQWDRCSEEAHRR